MLSKGLMVLLVAGLILGHSEAKSDSCNYDERDASEVDKDCSAGEYSYYVQCIRKRSKRHTDCVSDCGDGGSCNQNCGQCDCNQCSYSECSENCAACCVDYAPPCASRHCCHQTCQSVCRTSSCRRSCRANCQTSVDRGSASWSAGSSASHNVNNEVSAKNEAKTSNQIKHNITTVINLKTVVNNTNIVDVPISLNTTNHNNITVDSPPPGNISVNMNTNPGSTVIQVPQQTALHYSYQQQQRQCCNIISPRQCVPIQEPPFQNCYHTKSKVCGEVCTSATMHAEPHRVCEQESGTHSQTSCHEQVAYIPQPQPRCFSSAQWPYVNCMIAKPSCGGCYTHLVQGGSAPSTCPNSCYQNGIDVGPYYQQGPVSPLAYNNYPTSCGPNGCFPAQYGGVYGGYGYGQANPALEGSYQMQSLGTSFNEGVSNLTLQQVKELRKRHLSSEESSNDGDNSIEYQIEEFPIKMN